jgi:hypothetical protein
MQEFLHRRKITQRRSAVDCSVGPEHRVKQFDYLVCFGESMLVALLAHIAIPVVAGVALVFFVQATNPKGLSWNSCNEVALDFILISVGATGALFLNPKLTAKWGEKAAVYGILIVLINLFFASLLVYRSNHREGIVGRGAGFIDFCLGIAGLVLISLTYYVGYSE